MSAMKNMKKQMDEYIEEALFYYDLPGLSVLVQSEELNYQKAVGYSDHVKGEALSETHVFHMASVSKLFTAAGILQLQEQGKLALTDLLKTHLPYVKIADKRYEEIQLIHMLTHTSGMDDVTDYHWDQPRVDADALQDYACSEEVSGLDLLWSSMENRFRYSNVAYELLGLIISEVSGMSFESYMEKFIFEPLGMKGTTFFTPGRAGGSLELADLREAGMAMPHTKDGDNHIVLEKYYPYHRAHGPSSTLTTTLEELSKWGEACLRRKLFRAETYDKIWTPYAMVPNNHEKIGLGWFMRKQEGFDLYGHEGNDDGFRASFWICPEKHMQIIVVSNTTKAPVKRISKKLFEMAI